MGKHGARDVLGDAHDDLVAGRHSRRDGASAGEWCFRPQGHRTGRGHVTGVISQKAVWDQFPSGRCDLNRCVAACTQAASEYPNASSVSNQLNGEN